MSALATVVVRAGRGEEAALRRTLESLSRLDGLEIVVGADGAPGSGGVSGAARLVAAGAAGLNDALRGSDAGWLTTLRAGERLLPAWLRAVRESAADVLYGDAVLLDPETLRGRRVLPLPAWSRELFHGRPVVGRGVAFRRSRALCAGGFREGFPGAEELDLLLRVGEETTAIAHVAGPLHATFEDLPGDAFRAVAEDAARRDPAAPRVEGGEALRLRRAAVPRRTTVIVPTRDRVELLRPCLESLAAHTALPHEVLVVDNDSRDPGTLRYLESVDARVMPYPGEFHFSAMNNAAAEAARGDVLVFLNNDTVIHDDEWLPALLDHAMQPDVGAVGAKLLFPSGTLQHVGVVIHSGARPDHPFSNVREEAIDHPWFPKVACEVAAVTGACLAIRRDLFLRSGGFDPALRVAYNDIDLCLRLRALGYRIVFTPFAVLTHHECATRSPLPPLGDEVLFRARWAGTALDGDPFLGPVCRALGRRLAFPGGAHFRPELDAPSDRDFHAPGPGPGGGSR